jgi:hypothetical protein
MSGGNLDVGLNGVTGTLTFSSASTGAFTGIRVDASVIAGTTGTMNILSGAAVTGTSLAIATGNAATTGTLTISSNSALTLNGAATANIGLWVCRVAGLLCKGVACRATNPMSCCPAKRQ